jgi:hypothetical protein
MKIGFSIALFCFLMKTRSLAGYEFCSFLKKIKAAEWMTHSTMSKI